MKALNIVPASTASSVFYVDISGDVSQSGTLECDAITSTGNFSNGSNTLVYGAIKSTGNIKPTC